MRSIKTHHRIKKASIKEHKKTIPIKKPAQSRDHHIPGDRERTLRSEYATGTLVGNFIFFGE